jgi:hypothetical protein
MMGSQLNTILCALHYEVQDGAAAESRPWANSRTGSSGLFEVNIWMWRYGRVFPRKISVDDATEMLRIFVSKSRRKEQE